MYAFIELSGKQVKVEKGDIIQSLYLKDKKVGDKLEVSPVCFFDGKKLITEKGKLKDIKVICEIVEEKKGKKIYSFKKKAKIGYSKGYGHRDKLTVLKVNNIGKK
jgi:large subunit ribosomal protein L21